MRAVWIALALATGLAGCDDPVASGGAGAPDLGSPDTNPQDVNGFDGGADAPPADVQGPRDVLLDAPQDAAAPDLPQDGSDTSDAEDVLDASDAEDAQDAPDAGGCQPGFPSEPSLLWSVQGADNVFSSPRVVDLNDDGVLDVLFGQGVELADDDIDGRGAVVAVDGSTGAVLWSVSSRAEMVGSAMIEDLDGDGDVEVVLGGRFAALVAIDGPTGTPLWRFYPEGGAERDGLHNFYNGVIVPDVDGDSIQDLVLPNGGDSTKGPFVPREPGQLLLISGADGSVLRRAVLPDEGETYMSLVVHPGVPDGEPLLLFGTGGETFAGSLWAVPVSALLQEDLSSAMQLVSPVTHKGVIGPPALVDLNEDAVLDVLVATFDGRLLAVDVVTNELLWSVEPDGAFETYATPALGWIDDDQIPDVFYQVSRGAWPDYTESVAMAVSGMDGQVLWRETSSFPLYPSAVTADLNGDGRDEVIYGRTNAAMSRMNRRVLTPCALESAPLLPNASGGGVSTPWLGDLDGDGILDMVWALSSGSIRTATWTLERYVFEDVPVPPGDGWRAYMGTRADGRYTP